eukprot:15365186-Ditylum_brightwellii.AAC.3
MDIHLCRIVVVVVQLHQDMYTETEAIKLQYEEAWNLYPIEWVLMGQTGAVPMPLLSGGVFCIRLRSVMARSG